MTSYKLYDVCKKIIDDGDVIIIAFLIFLELVSITSFMHNIFGQKLEIVTN